MCGRFNSYHSSSEIAKTFDLADVPELKPRYNIAPTTEVAAIINSESGDRKFQWLRWGLIPHWAKDKNIGNKLINARAETVAEKPSFRSAFKHSRCLIIASGFYEWQQQEGGKQPFLIQQTDNLPFAFAGLWSSWHRDGETINSCTIITTEANEIMTPIHHRMPVILPSDRYDLWLDPTIERSQLLQSLLQPLNGDRLQAHPVSTKVNNPRNDSPDCLRSVGE
jgi:putative SOS response-associated peptidase YedK